MALGWGRLLLDEQNGAMSDRSNDPEFLRQLLESLPFRISVRNRDDETVYSNARNEAPCPQEGSVHPILLPETGEQLVLWLGPGPIAPPTSSHGDTDRMLRHAQRMEAVGRLTGGIAHEYNNLLGIILGYSELFADALPPDSQDSADIEAIRRAAERGKELTGQLLAFSRQELLEPRRVKVNERVRNLQKLLEHTLGEDIRLKLVLGDPPDVYVDPGALEQVILNLMVNAREAMPTGGVLTLRTRDTELPNTDQSSTPGRHAGILVQDTGPGIEADVLEHIFDPFFTTKNFGEGSGLGLSMVDGIVAQSGGRVRVSSAPDEGTTFEVLLPAHVEEPGADENPMPLSSPGGVRTVLVVEDEAPLRRLVCRHLQGAGYNTLSASDAAAALETYEAFPGRVHAVLTDVVMPGQSGVELVAALRERQPKLRVLYMTGYTDASALRHGIDPRRASIIRKPFERSLLLARLAEILDPAQRVDQGES